MKKQLEFWKGPFGKIYTDRNTFNYRQWERLNKKRYGITKAEIFKHAFKNLNKRIKILEVGCNIGLEMKELAKMGFQNIYGIELQEYAVKKAHEINPELNIIQGSGFDIPFKDKYFDLVMTNGVLIHISPKAIKKFMNEIYRVSSKYIYGHEYYSQNFQEIKYRGNKDVLWKGDFAKIYCNTFPNIKILHRELLPYKNTEEKGNTDISFLLKIQ